MDIMKEEAISLLNNSKISLEGISKASLVCSAFAIQKYVILHAGPAIKYEDMNIVMKQAIQIAIIYEGWANNAHEAEILASSNKIKYLPSINYSFSSRGAGIISPSMPIMVFKNENNNSRAYATIADGFNKSMDTGYLSNEAIMRLKWIEQVLAIDMENNNHNVDITCILHNECNKEEFITKLGSNYSLESINFINKDNSFYYSILFGAYKCLLNSIDTYGSNIITSINSNGRDFVIRLNNKNHVFPNNLLIGNINIDKELIMGDFYMGNKLTKTIDTFLDALLTYKVEIISKMGGIGVLRSEEITLDKSVLFELLDSNS